MLDNSYLERELMVLGEDVVKYIQSKKILVFGCGGVGGACIESLTRAGVIYLDIVDADTVSKSNINRQIIALNSTIGKMKTDVVADRMLDINPCIEMKKYAIFYGEETYNLIDLAQYDYVIDCIDTVTSKIHLVEECNKLSIPLLAATGTGNRLDPTQFVITDIYKTKNDPLCRVLRSELRKRGIKKLMVLASNEIPTKIPDERKMKDLESGRNIPGSISFVPPVAGMIMASYVIRCFIEEYKKTHL